MIYHALRANIYIYIYIFKKVGFLYNGWYGYFLLLLFVYIRNMRVYQ